MGSQFRTRDTLKAVEPPLFREVQRFHHWFFWLPIIVVVGVIWWQFIEQIIIGRPQGTEPISDWAAWVLTLLFGIGFPVFAAIVRLVTEVRPGSLSIRLVPFRGRVVPTDDIETAYSREYSPMREFGGWGVRLAADGGRAYNAHGKEGVQLVLRDGRRILVGTQRAEQLLGALRSAGAKV
jgi:hypothetical protein